MAISSSHTLIHRKDIDGLRAIAVISVILSHYFPSILSGGFVGVDIFFVISGYLITGILLNELATDTFSIISFYSRRARRIFPALLFLLLVVALAGWFYLLPQEFEKLGKHVAFGTVFLANVAYWLEVGYFDTVAELKPLLHLWSLGVEEQFYILWPVLLLIVSRVPSRFALVIFILMLMLASFAAAIAIAGGASASFYLPHTRLWELLVGGLLAHSQQKYFPVNKPAVWMSHVLSIAGLGMIIFSFFWINEKMLFPHWIALLPVVGAAVVIAAGSSALPNRFFLSHPVMVFVGLISYPLYLWHWPILSFGKIINEELTISHRLVLLLLSLLLATATYYWLEKPLRKHRPTGKLLVTYLVVAVAVMILGVLCQQQIIKPKAAITDDISKIQTAMREWDYPSALLQQNSFTVDDRIYYQAGNNDKAVLFIGDSNMEQYAARMSELSSTPKARRVIFATQGACLPMNHLDDKWRLSDNCQTYALKAMFLALARPDIDTVVFAGQWAIQFNNHLTPDAQKKDYTDLQIEISRLKQAGKKVYLVLNIPVDDQLNPRSLFRRSYSGAFVVLHNRGIQEDIFVKDISPVINPLREIARQTGATLIDPLEYLCMNNFCPATLEDGKPIYKDASHLSLQFVKQHMTYLDQTVLL